MGKPNRRLLETETREARAISSGPTFDYNPSYRSVLDSITNNRHIQESRLAQGRPENHMAVCKATAAVLALINNQDRQEIPKGNWAAYHGKIILDPKLERGCFAINLFELKKLTGIKDFPSNILRDGDTIPRTCICVIWGRELQAGDDLRLERIRTSKIVTAFPSIRLDQAFESSTKEIHWIPFGRKTEHKNLVSNILAKIKSE